MKLLICGSRAINDYALLLNALKESGYKPTSIVSGGSPGVDSLAERYAREVGLPLEVFRPDYKRYGGKKAPLVRDCDMVIASDAVLALWNGFSRGTKFTVDYAVRKDKPVWVKEVRQ